MADPPPAVVSALPQPDHLAGSVSTPQNPNPNPQIPPSPTVSDLSAHMSSPQQVDPAAATVSSVGSMEFPPQLQAASPTQANVGYGQIQRSRSASRLSAANHIPQYAAIAARMYGGQMNFSGNQQQQQQLAARAAMLGQGQLGLLQGQGNAASAAHFGLQSQMMGQPRQKGMVQGINSANAAQALQGMQSMGVMGTLGMNQMRPNGTIPYSGAQQRFVHAQLSPQVSQQAALSPQKVAGQGLSRTSSIAALNSLIPGSSQNGQVVAMSMPQQQQQQAQQWLNKMQSSMGSPVSPQQQFQQQQRLLLLQQIQQKTGLSPQQFAQIQQQHPHLTANQLIQQQHLLQQFQQQQSPRVSASGSQKSTNLTGSQPGTPLSGGTMTGGSASQGAEGSSQLLGKRKIQDLVTQVDPLSEVDPDVEDLLLEIADDFIESVTAFACTLAKHRKSSGVEAKDVLLHLEKNWHLSVPGFSGEAKNPQRDSVKSLVDPQQSESVAAGIRGTSNKFIANNLAGNHQIRPQVAEPSPMPVVAPSSKVPRF